MPKVKVNDINMNYEKQGAGEPLILIPFTTADNACYAFQVPEYSKHFTCFSVDPRGAGETDKPEGNYSTELFADDIAGFMQAVGIEKAHIAGVSLGAAIGMWLGAKYPDKVKSLSLHSGWTKTVLFLKTVVEGWQGRGRPAQPLDAFIRQSNAVIAHDCESQLGKIKAPTQITFGRHDMVTSTRFADRMKNNIKNSELLIFEDCSHAGLYEKTEEFNQRTLEFLKRHSG